jgi:hypothetical protein
MKNNRHLHTAEIFGIKEQCEKLERELLAIDGVTDIDIDLDGFYDDLGQVIFLARYEIPSEEPYDSWFFKYTRIKTEIIEICKNNDLYPSGDRIEDYGAHFYLVRQCGKEWRIK